MATKGARSKTKSSAQSEPASTASAPSEPATETQSGPVTMTEALERLLPHCEGSPFKVAEWLDTKHRRGDVGLLGGGVAMSPSANPAMLGIAAHVMPATGKPVLYVQVRQALGAGYPIWDCETLIWDDNTKKLSLDKHHEFWAYDRTTFEQHFPGGDPKNRGGRPSKYNRESILIEGAVVACEIALEEGSLPQPLTLEWLCGEVEHRMLAGSPGPTLLKEVLSPLFWRLKDVQDRR